MKKIRGKIILAFLLVTLLPAIPLSYVVNRILDSVVKIGWNEIEESLEQGIEFSKLYYDNEKDKLKLILKEVSAEKEIFGKREFEKLKLFSENYALSSIEVFSPTKKNLFSYQKNDFPKLENFDFLQSPTKTKVIPLKGNKNFLVGITPISLSDSTFFLVSGIKLSPNFQEKSEKTLEVLNTFRFLQDEKETVTERFFYAFLTVYALILIVSFLISSLLSKKITSPIKVLVEATRKISEGDLKLRVEETSNDEIGKLQSSMNFMLDKIDDEHKKVLQLQKTAAWREIARSLAHEIKNPLTPIQLTIQELKDRYKGEDEEFKFFLENCTEIITEEVDSLKKLVNEFSEFARSPKLELSVGNLANLVEDTIQLYSNKGIIFESSETPDFNFDQDKIKRVFINLLENAILSSSEKDREIKVRLRAEKDFVVLEVQDNGSGISAENLDKIFEPHFTTRTTGMGLGLAIVKGVVEKHNGRIEVQSEEGKGSIFQVFLSLNT